MNILERIENKRLVPRYFNLTIALLIAAVSYNLLLQPFDLVTGGTNGVAVILNDLYNLNPAIVIFVLSIILTSLSLIFLDVDYSFSMIYIAIVYPIMVHFTSFVPELIKLNTNDLLIVSIFGGALSGLSNGIIYKNGLSSGGFNVIAKILYDYKHISISITNTFFPLSASAADRFIEVVVFPTPPFWFAIAITLPIFPPIFKTHYIKYNINSSMWFNSFHLYYQLFL